MPVSNSTRPALVRRGPAAIVAQLRDDGTDPQAALLWGRSG
jgi:hypothetical protein